MRRHILYLTASLAAAVVLTATSAHADLASYTAAVLADNPVGYWQFEESSGPVALNSSSGGALYDGLYVNSAAPGASGGPMGGNSATFNPATTDHVSLPGTWGGAGWSELTIEAWINPAGGAGPMVGLQTIVGNPNLNEFTSIQCQDGGTSAFPVATDTAGPPGQLLSPNVSPLNEWRHVVLVAESGDTRLYIDGVRFVTETDAFNYVPSSDSVTIGKGFDVRPFNGLIDEVAIYDRALTDSEVLGHYQRGLGTLSDDSRAFDRRAGDAGGREPGAGVAAMAADSFGTGVNQFTIDFVEVSGATNPSTGDTIPTSGYGIVDYDYRMATHEITNDQWNKFKAAYGPVTGSQGGYSSDSYFTGTSVPADRVSWYEAAQFINWLNTSTGNQAAYKFTGTQGTGDYTFAAWSPTDPGYDAGNPYRNKAAKYFLPTEDEWVKAAYWNGTGLQVYATKLAGLSLPQGDGVSGTGWNYVYDNGFATDPYGPWNVGSGSQELHDTYDMMGNVWEWMENPYTSGDYDAGSTRALRGGYWNFNENFLASSGRRDSLSNPTYEYWFIGLRVASVPEPGSLAMLLGIALTALLYYWRKHV